MRAAENLPVIKSRKKILTYDDYAALTPPDSGNYELHNGKIVFMPSPTPRHQDIVTALTAYMRIFAMENKLGKVYTAPLDVVFTTINTFQPDISFPKPGNTSSATKKSTARPTSWSKCSRNATSLRR